MRIDITYISYCRWVTYLAILNAICISQGFCQKIPHQINNETFVSLFSQEFEEFKSLLITPPAPQSPKALFIQTNPYRSYFILFYNPLFEQSLETRQIYHQYYAEYSRKLTDLLRKRGAKDFQDFQSGFNQATQICEVDCSQFQEFCQFFNIQIYPTFFYFTGLPQNQDPIGKQRAVYQYTSWISSQEMLYFVMKAYSHKMIDLARVRPIQINSNLNRQIKWILTNQMAMYIVCFLVFPFLFGYCFMSKPKVPNPPDQKNKVQQKQQVEQKLIERQQKKQQKKAQIKEQKKVQSENIKGGKKNKKKNN